jgi:hypothetical protein
VRVRLTVLTFTLALVGILALPASGQAYLTGIADEQPGMFDNPLYLQIVHRQKPSQRISRFIVPYDAADGSAANGYFLDRFRLALRGAQAAHVQLMVAFYHSSANTTAATRMPTVARYEQDVRRFMRRFPQITVYQPWNEANRGNVAHQFSSPSASQAAQYYVALKRACHRCTIAGLDVLDAQNIGPTLTYIRSFERAVRGAGSGLPTIWGLHNYSDTNRNSTSRTRAVLSIVPGQVWLTETGGVVQLLPTFTNRHGEGLSRAARALRFMFRLAGVSSRISRLYIFQWSGASPDTRFDAGLIATNGVPRPGYYTVCNQLLRNSSLCRSSHVLALVKSQHAAHGNSQLSAGTVGSGQVPAPRSGSGGASAPGG